MGRSSADSKNHCNEISMQSEQELLHILAEAEEDAVNGQLRQSNRCLQIYARPCQI